jgi:hypothetical protein
MRHPTPAFEHTWAFECQGCGDHFKGDARHDEQIGGPRCPTCGSYDRVHLTGHDLIEAAEAEDASRTVRVVRISRFKALLPWSARTTDADLESAEAIHLLTHCTY